MPKILNIVKPYVEECYYNYSSLNLNTSRHEAFAKIDNFNNCPKSPDFIWAYITSAASFTISGIFATIAKQTNKPSDCVPAALGFAGTGLIFFIAAILEHVNFVQQTQKNCLSCDEKIDIIAYSESIASAEVRENIISPSPNFELCTTMFDYSTTTIFNDYC